MKKNTIEMPGNLEAVTHHGREAEVDPVDAGLSAGAADAIWDAVRRLYRTGTQPGITLSLRRHGRVILNRGIGHARGNGPGDAPGEVAVPATPDTPFCLFSASKALTAMLVHKLAEQGALRLSDPVAKYVPEFAAHGKGRTTIRQLLAHRAGIPSVPVKNPTPELIQDWDRVVALLCAAKPVSKNGGVQAYHALTGGFVAGELVQRVTGNPLRETFADFFQKPMGLRYCNYGAAEADIPDVARNYMTGPVPRFPVSYVARRALSVPFERAVEVSNQPDFLRAVVPAGNIVASASETGRFFQMLLGGGELDGVRVMQPETVERAVEVTTRRQFDHTLFAPIRYSAGMMRGDNPVGLFGPGTGAAFGHLGFINILCWADPSRALSVALLTNGKPALTPHLISLGLLLRAIGRHCPPVPALESAPSAV